MSEAAAEMVWMLIAGYAAIGAAIGCALLAGGLARVDALAQAAPLRVKLLWLPSFVVMWPALLVRLIRSRPEETP